MRLSASVTIMTLSSDRWSDKHDPVCVTYTCPCKKRVSNGNNKVTPASITLIACVIVITLRCDRWWDKHDPLCVIHTSPCKKRGFTQQVNWHELTWWSDTVSIRDRETKEVSCMLRNRDVSSENTQSKNTYMKSNVCDFMHVA